MVVSLGPGKFYGSSLPRPYIYTDVKYNDHRVDPPVSVMDPFLSWANEAHWSMGGLSRTRLRLQGRIEGNIKKLRAEQEKIVRKQNRNVKGSKGSDLDEYDSKIDGSNKRGASVSPPPAPIVSKRRRFMAFIDEEDEEEKDLVAEKERIAMRNCEGRRKLARKLGDDFDRVARVKESTGSGTGTVSSRTRSRRSEEDSSSDVVVTKMAEKVSRKKVKSYGNGDSSPVRSIRTSPRLAKRG